MHNKVLLFCLDALCTQDLTYMKTLPNFSKVISQGSLVKHVEPVYPSLTYPNHCSIITGNSVAKHGVAHNEMVEVNCDDAPWYTLKSQIKCDTLLDIASQHGLSTCSITWPVSGGADYTFNLPMIVPIAYQGDNARQFYENNATQALIDRYFWRYEHYLVGENRNLDEFTMAVSLDILKDYGQCDIMVIKMCDLDTVKHVNGVENEAVHAQLRKHDQQLGILIEALKRYGDYEHTNIVILGDHGQADVKRHINFNLVLKDKGLLSVDENNQLKDWQAYCHSCAMSAWIEVKDHNPQLIAKVATVLNEIKEEPQYNIERVYTKQEALTLFGLDNEHIDFVLEAKEPMSFSATLAGEDLFKEYLKPGWHYSLASHGYLPSKDETTMFIACGPNVKQGVVIERSSILNDAPTMAKMLGFELTNVDGKSWENLLKE